MGKRLPSSDRSSLRPRWSTWRRSLGGLLLWGAFILLQPGYKPEKLTFLGSIIALGLLAMGLYSWYEHRYRPSLLRFWVDPRGVEIQIRKAGTREILLESSSATLRGQDLSDIALPGAVLSGLDLSKVKLAGADLHGAQLRSGHLMSAVLTGADLRGANLEYADLTAADLRGADLRGARLAATSLAQADLRGADLRGADFAGHGANRVLWEGRIGSAQFEGALYDETTRWPPGFNPRRKGCVLTEGSTARLPIPAETESVRLEQLPAPAAAPRTVSAEVAPAEQANRVHQG